MDSPLLDSVHTIQTPEGIELHLNIAGIWSRSVAWIIDLLIRSVIYIILGYTGLLLGDLGSGLLMIGFFLLEWFYPVVFEVFNQGMTPGKQYLNIQVVNSDGTPIGWSPSMIRNILRVVDFLPLFYAFGFVSMLMNNRFQRLGDLAAKTLVVYNDDNMQKNSIPVQSIIPLTQKLKLEEAKSIIHYAERSHQLSDERLDELAQILNILDEPHYKMTKAKLLGIANGLAGRK